MMSVATTIETALRTASVPFVSVSLRVISDRTTWTIVYPATATAQDRTNGQNVLDTVDVSATAVGDRDAMDNIDELKLRAVTQGLYENWANPLMTKAQLRTRIINIYKALVG